MNLASILDRYANELDTIARRRGVGAREDCACAILLEAIAGELGDGALRERPPIVPSTTGNPVDAARFAEGRQRVRDLDDEAILRLLGRR